METMILSGRPHQREDRFGGIEFIEKIGELLGRDLKLKKGGRPKKRNFKGKRE